MICPHCEEELEIEELVPFGVCPHCGEQIDEEELYED